MQFDRRGAGPFLVLLSGLACDARLWESVAAELEPSFTVIVPHVWEARSLSEAAFAVNGLLDELATSTTGAAGLSMGGYILFELLRHAPERVRAAAFLDTTAFPDGPERKQARSRTLELLDQGRFEEVLATFAAGVLAPTHPDESPARRTVLSMARDLGPTVFRAQTSAVLERRAYSEVLRLLRVPALFLAGELDAITPPEVATRMAGEVPGAELHVIRGAGHLTPLEAPGPVAEILAPFFRRALLA